MQRYLILFVLLLLSYKDYGQKAKYITEYIDMDTTYLVYMENGKKRRIENAVAIDDFNGTPWIYHQGDYNFDGYLDVLVSWWGGGTCCPPRGQLFFYDGKQFHKSEVLGYSDMGTITRNPEGKYRFKMREDDDESENEVCYYKTIVWGVKGFRAVKLLELHDKYVKVQREIRASMFSPEDDSEKILLYDLDGDGKKDKIVCSLMFSYNFHMCFDIYFGNGKKSNGYLHVSRVGILYTKTNGVYDLVVDCGSVLKWNGKEYEYR